MTAIGPKECPNADDVGAALDLAIEALDGVRRVQLRAVFLWEGHVGQHVVLVRAMALTVHDGGELRHLGSDLVGDGTPLGAGGLRGVLGEGDGDEGRDGEPMKRQWSERHWRTRPLFPAWARALRWKWTRHLCHVALSTLETAALMPSWASLMTSLTPRRPRRVSLRRNSVQIGSASDVPISRPRTSRRPSVFTPMAMMTATDTIRPPRRTLR
jgi:hypothetical protein